MSDTMDCRRAEELFSDHLEGTLGEVLRADLEAHLSACADCRTLRAAFAQVVSTLGQHPVLEPPAGLAERAAAAALAKPRAVAQSPRRLALRRFLAAAAGITLAVTGTVLLASGSTEEGPPLAAHRLMDRAANAGVYLLERKDRLVEDLRLLRVVISTAFEGRLDRVNDRVEDYRRLLERQRNAEPQKKSGSDAGELPGRNARRGIFHGTFSEENMKSVHLVKQSENSEGCPGETQGVPSRRSIE